MKIHVSSLALSHEVVAEHRPEKVVSLLGPGTQFPVFEGLPLPDHHKVELDDIRKHIDGYVTPEENHVFALIEFLCEWNPAMGLLAHCWAGISRSTATAFIAACIHNPDADENIIARAIADASPTAYPNTLIVSIADEILKRDGKMAAAANAICDDEQRIVNIRSVEEAAPFFIPSKF